MSELSAGLRDFEVAERTAYYRERARRELVGVARQERSVRLPLAWVRRARRGG